MMHILEYILENYTWFLVGIVLILLAIIGYYADKTNFGHGKKNTQKENDILQDNDKTINIENIGLLDATEGEKKEVPVNEDIKNDNSGDVNNLVSQNVESIYNDPSNKTLENGVKNIDESVNQIQNDLVNQSNNVMNLSAAIPSEQIDNLQNKENNADDDNTLQINEEKFNMFSAEFESLLPKKNIINTDLLSDIDDLELDKTQKIDLNGVPDLDDIELPKIMELSEENEDIWKF